MATNRIEFENVSGRDILFRNFSGAELKYNQAGKRNFCMIVDDETAEELRARGFNVKTRKRADTEEEYSFLKININFNSNRPPQINQVTSRGGMSRLTEETIDSLDYAEIISANIAISPYDREKNGQCTAWLNELLVEIEDESFASRYRSEHDDD